MSVKKASDPQKRAKLSEWIKRNTSTSSKNGTSEISPAPSGADIPLSFGQERLWFLQQLHPSNPFYHYTDIFEINGKVDLGCLQEAFLALVNRHGILRTTFHVNEEENKRTQRVHSHSELEWKLWDASLASGVVDETTLQEDIIREVRKPFTLEQGPLFRVILVRRSATQYWMVLCFHHMIVDEQSVKVLLKELIHFYQSPSSSLDASALAYKDFAYWQRNKPANNSSELTYWKEKLKGEIPILSLPIDYPRSDTPSYEGSYYFSSLPTGIGPKVEKYGKEWGVTPFVLLLTTYKILFHKYGKDEDIWVGTPFSNRDRVALEQVMGFFNETQVLRTFIRGEMSFEACVKAVQQTVLEAFTHKNMPFESLVSALNPERVVGVNPLFQVMFLYQEKSEPYTLAPGVEISHKPFDYGVSKFDLSLMVVKEEESFSTILEYSTELFEKSTIERLKDSFSLLLEQALENPKRPIKEFSLLSIEERDHLLAMGQGPQLDFPPYASIYEAFQQQVRTRGEYKAVSFQEQSLSYKELDEKSASLATHLLGKGVKPGDRVGLCANPSVELMVGIWGIIRAGAAYVPLDPSYPAERLSYMVAEAKIGAVIAEDSLLGIFEQEELELISLAQGIQSDDSLNGIQPKLPILSGAGEAYVIFTSGSSGKPKGVPITHKNLLHSTFARTTYYPHNPDAFLLLSSFSFDSSVAGIFWTICSGGTLVWAEKRIEQDMGKLSRLIAEKGITHSLMLPSLYELLLAHGNLSSFDQLSTLIVAGEACSPTLVATHFERLPQVSLFNEYGPTEASVWCTVHQVSKEDQHKSVVPIGVPIARTDVYVLDEERQVVPMGMPGELYVGGEGLAPGYLNRPDLTKKKFVSHPFSTAPEARLYRTGDLVRFDHDGRLLFLGRVDNQVKIRGFRIELDEIAEELKQLEEIDAATVQVSEEKELIGYLVAKGSIPHSDIRRKLMAALPAYMVPATYVQLESFPKLPNGKINTQKLPLPQKAMARDSANHTPPKTAFEKTMVKVWEKVLKKHPIGIHDNFFQLGGDSLLSIHLLAEARKEGIQLGSTQLFEGPTIAQLQKKIKGGEETPQDEVQKEGEAYIAPPSFQPEVSLSQEELDIIFRQLSR